MSKLICAERRQGADHSGVLLIGHGTRDPLGTQQFLELGKRLVDAMHPIPTESALLEFQHPTIQEAWESLVSRGVRHVHVAPLLLFAAGHAKEDIPVEIERCRELSPGVTFDQSRPLSRHPSIIELVTARLGEALQLPAHPSERTAIVLVGRGNRDPCAQADMQVMTEVIRHRIACGELTMAFYAMAKPSLPEVLDRLASTSRFDQILVYPHLLFQGRLLEAIERQIQEAAIRHPDIGFLAAKHLGPDPSIAEAIRMRILQTIPVTAAECR
ncbi:MAG: sirohydrochlorin chelatase [Planctomycetota bacterium]|nr:sirohydrochlorin chelatase [Planctomycetota bacterium]